MVNKLVRKALYAQIESIEYYGKRFVYGPFSTEGLVEKVKKLKELENPKKTIKELKILRQSVFT